VRMENGDAGTWQLSEGEHSVALVEHLGAFYLVDPRAPNEPYGPFRSRTRALLAFEQALRRPRRRHNIYRAGVLTRQIWDG
jgi:hypothetical protein